MDQLCVFENIMKNIDLFEGNSIYRSLQSKWFLEFRFVIWRKQCTSNFLHEFWNQWHTFIATSISSSIMMMMLMMLSLMLMMLSLMMLVITCSLSCCWHTTEDHNTETVLVRNGRYYSLNSIRHFVKQINRIFILDFNVSEASFCSLPAKVDFSMMLMREYHERIHHYYTSWNINQIN